MKSVFYFVDIFSLYLLQSKVGTPGMREALTNPHPRKALSDSSSTVDRDGTLADTANQILLKAGSRLKAFLNMAGVKILPASGFIRYSCFMYVFHLQVRGGIL